MTHVIKLPLYLSFKALQEKLGWPYGRTHTDRLINDPAYSNRRFPAPGKIGKNIRNAHPMFFTPDVLAYFKDHGLRVPDEVEYF